MCKHAIKKLPFLIRYVPDQKKTLETGGTLNFAPDCYKIKKKKCNKTIDNYAHAL